jgi:raffinose/stachyose/melibiose transport system substrate-binding protein
MNKRISSGLLIFALIFAGPILASFGLAANQKIVLRILTRYSDNSLRSAALRDRTQEFMKLNPDIEIQDESVYDENIYNNKFKTAVATGDVQAIWQNYGGAAFKPYIDNKVVMNLEPYLTRDQKWSGAFIPFLFDMWRYDKVKGIYGVPLEFYSVAIYYNRDLFKRIDAAPPKTLEEFTEVCKKFRSIGIIPMKMGDKDNFRGGQLFTYLVLKKFGFQKIQDLVSRKAKWTDPDMVALLEMMKQWQDMGIFGENMVTTDNNEALQAFFDEKSAMTMDGSWAINQMIAGPIADKVGVFAFPYFKDRPQFKNVWFGGPGGLSVSGSLSGAKKDAAIKLLKFLTSVDSFQQQLKVSKGDIFPVKMEADPTDVPPLMLEYQKALSAASDFRVEIEVYDPIPQLQDKVRNEIQGLFAGQGPQQTAQAIQDEISKSLRK